MTIAELIKDLTEYAEDSEKGCKMALKWRKPPHSRKEPIGLTKIVSPFSMPPLVLIEPL